MLKDRIKEITRGFEEKALTEKEIYDINKEIKDEMTISSRRYKTRNVMSEIDGNKIYVYC